MDKLVIYKGKYGATRQYAEWVAAELDCPLAEAGKEDAKQLKEAGLVIIGTSVYIGKLQVKQWLRENEQVLLGKQLFLFLVAGTPPNETAKLKAYITACVPQRIRRQCSFFYLPGRLVKSKLSWKDRFMLRMGARLAKDPKDRAGMLTDYDHVSKDKLAALLQAVKPGVLAG